MGPHHIEGQRTTFRQSIDFAYFPTGISNRFFVSRIVNGFTNSVIYSQDGDIFLGLNSVIGLALALDALFGIASAQINVNRNVLNDFSSVTTILSVPAAKLPHPCLIFSATLT